jgi:hypothetical protein
LLFVKKGRPLLAIVILSSISSKSTKTQPKTKNSCFDSSRRTIKENMHSTSTRHHDLKECGMIQQGLGKQYRNENKLKAKLVKRNNLGQSEVDSCQTQ